MDKIQENTFTEFLSNVAASLPEAHISLLHHGMRWDLFPDPKKLILCSWYMFTFVAVNVTSQLWSSKQMRCLMNTGISSLTF
jgi:hypothetical protein